MRRLAFHVACFLAGLSVGAMVAGWSAAEVDAIQTAALIATVLYVAVVETRPCVKCGHKA